MHDATPLTEHPRRDQDRPWWRSDLTAGAVVFLAVGLGLLAVFVVANLVDVPQSRLAKDPAQVTGSPWYTGSLSILGVATWAVGNAIAIFVGVLVPRSGRKLLVAVGAFGLILVLDDALIFHETIKYEVGLGPVTEKAVYLAYVLALLAVLVTYRAVLLGPGTLIFAVGLSFLGMSMGSDILEGPNFLEDSLKIMGIVGWTTGLITRSAHVVRDPEIPVANASGRRDLERQAP